jgi:hypothetical protein
LPNRVRNKLQALQASRRCNGFAPGLHRRCPESRRNLF